MPAELLAPVDRPVAGAGGGRVVLTIVNDVGPTSMPFNEFVVYRAGHLSGERHRVVSWGPSKAHDVLKGVSAEAAAKIELLEAGSKPGALRRLCQQVVEEAGAEGTPLVVHLHQPKSGMVFQGIKRTLGVSLPVLFTVHNTFDKYTWPNRALSAINFVLADAVSFVSRSAAAAYPAALRRSHPLNLPIPNGVDLARVDALLEQVGSGHAAGSRPFDARAHGERLKLINIGRFVDQKNHRFLIELMAALPAHVTLTLVGDGPLRDRVREWAEECGVAERIRFTGLISREDVYRELLAADVFVSGSLWEGLPIAVLEAMALRKPVVLSDIGPHREIAEVGPACRVLPLEVESWRAQLVRWAEQGAPALAQIGAENRRTVESHLSLERMHQEYTRLYERLAAPVGAIRA